MAIQHSPANASWDMNEIAAPPTPKLLRVFRNLRRPIRVNFLLFSDILSPVNLVSFRIYNIYLHFQTSLFCRRSLIASSCHSGIEEGSDTALAVSNTNDIEQFVRA